MQCSLNSLSSSPVKCLCFAKVLPINMSSRRSSFPSTRSGTGTSASNTGRSNYSNYSNLSINSNSNASVSRRSSAIVTNRNLNRDRVATPGSAITAIASIRNARTPVRTRTPATRRSELHVNDQPGHGGYGDYIPGVRQHTPGTDALARELEALRARGESEFGPQLQPRLIKRRDQSTYFRGADATGFHVTNPRPENRLDRMMPLMTETKDATINWDVLEKTLPSTFYSTRMKYGDSLNPANKDREEDYLHKFRISSATSDAARVDDPPSSRAPIDSPQFQMPRIKGSYSNKSPRTRNYSSAHGMDGPPVAENGGDDAIGGRGSGSETSSTAEEGTATESTSDSENVVEDDPRQKLQQRERKQFQKNHEKEMQKGFLKSKEKVDRVFADMSTTAARKPTQLSASKSGNLSQTGAGKSGVRTGYSKLTHTPSSFLDKNIEELQRELNALPSLQNRTANAIMPPVVPTRANKKLSPLAGQRPALSTSSLNAPKQFVETNKTIIAKPPLASPAVFSSPSFRSRINEPAARSSSSLELVDKVKALHEKVKTIVPPTHPNRKLLIGRKNLLSSSTAPPSKGPAGRQHAPSLSSKSGLTMVTTSSDMDPTDDLMRERNSISRAVAHSASQARREVERLKQKLGITPGFRLKPSLDKLSNTPDPVLDNLDSIHLNSQLRLSQATKSSKMVRDRFQARDAEMIAAKRQAILAKANQQKSKYLLTDEELKQRIQASRPSRLFEPTQVSLQRMQPKLANYVPKQFTHLLKQKKEEEEKKNRSRVATILLKPPTTIQSTPKRAVPAWRSI